MITSINFENGQPFLTNRFVKTKGYLEEEKIDKFIYWGVFGTQKNGGILNNALDLKFKNIANTHVIKLGDEILALWEAAGPHAMDPDSLDTIGLTTLKGVLKPNEAFSAHPKTDLNSNVSSELLVTFGVQTGPKRTIRLMEFDNAGTNSGDLIFDRKDTFNGFAFLHDFAITTNWAIFLQNDGYGYLTAPTVSISTSPGVDATAVAIMTSRSGIGTAKSIDKILLINPGSGYIGIPTVTVPGAGIATAGITTLGSVGIVTITSGGSGYTTTPNVAITTAPSGGTDATAEAVMVGGTISAIRISNAGSGYVSAPTITIGAATSIGDGNYIFNETVQVSSDSSETARVKVWDADSRTLDVSMLTKMQFQVGEKIKGLESGAEYVILSVSYDQPNDYPNEEYGANQYNDNANFESEADAILDFSEGNPFGTF